MTSDEALSYANERLVDSVRDTKVARDRMLATPYTDVRAKALSDYYVFKREAVEWAQIAHGLSGGVR